MLLTSLLKYRATIRLWSQSETLLGLLRLMGTDRSAVEGILRVYGSPPEGEAFLDSISWMPPTVSAPWTGYALAPGTSANARINAWGFRDDRDRYPRHGQLYRTILTGGSTAYGSGAPSQDATVAGWMEHRLNSLHTPQSGMTYEVVNAGLPASTTMHEQVLIHSRLRDIQPDRIVMLSGHNDISYAHLGRNPNWQFVFVSRNHAAVINELRRDVGLRHPQSETAFALADRLSPVEVARLVAANVAVSAASCAVDHIECVFVLQPDVWSAPKTLTAREQAMVARLSEDSRVYWRACQDEIRRQLADAADRVANLRFVDASRSITGADDVFLDSCHFGGAGHELVARAIVDALDWRPARGRAAS
jgi:hypothetical protein